MADKKISQLTPTTTVDLADKYALARGAGNFYVSYQTLQNNLSTPTGSFVKTVNAVVPDAAGNVAISLASVETGLSSSFPPLPVDGDVYVISGETATDRTGSNGQSFIYSSASADWFRLSGLDEAGNDARYVDVSGDTMTGALTLPSDPIVALHAATKQYVDNATAVGTDAQTLRFNGTTLEASSLLTNDGTNIGIGTVSTPQEQLEIRRQVAAGNDNFVLQLTNPLTTLDSRVGILFVDNTSTGAARDGAAIQVRNSNVNGRGHLTFGPVQNMVMSEVMRITQDQNVGIGTDNVTSKLVVDGTSKFSGSMDMSSNKITNVTDPTSAQDAATKNYVDTLSVGTAWAGGYLSGQGSYANKYDLTQTFNSNNGDVSWSTANDEWALTEPGTYLISTNGYWQDVNSKTVEIRYNTTAGQGATSGTLAASQAADTTARRWDFFTTLTITSTVYLWVHNTSGTGIVRNWKIQIQRLY